MRLGPLSASKCVGDIQDHAKKNMLIPSHSASLTHYMLDVTAEILLGIVLLFPFVVAASFVSLIRVEGGT